MTPSCFGAKALPIRFAVCLLTAAVVAACGGGLADGTSVAAHSNEAASVDDTTSAFAAGGFGDTETSTDTDAAGTQELDNALRSTAALARPPVAPAATPAVAVVDPLAVYIDAALMPARALGFSTERVKTTGELPPVTNIGAFRVSCGFSHMASDDPIVYPNQPGQSHLHTFFGNTGTDANSTAQSIADTGNSTCNGGIINRTAYWVPTMIDTKNGAPIRPLSAMIYYKTGYNGIVPANVRPFPAGLRMIAGSPKNTIAKGPFQYKCIGMGAENLVGANIQNCPVGAQLWAVVFFQQCWDGVNLDSPDHKSHMSYTVNRACPITHPVALPEVSFNIIYTVNETNAPLRWRLSSDAYDRSLPAGYSAHGDWFNGWKPEVMETFVAKCDQASTDCHAHLLGDGRAFY